MQYAVVIIKSAERGFKFIALPPVHVTPSNAPPRSSRMLIKRARIRTRAHGNSQIVLMTK